MRALLIVLATCAAAFGAKRLPDDQQSLHVGMEFKIGELKAKLQMFNGKEWMVVNAVGDFRWLRWMTPEEIKKERSPHE